MKYSFYILSFLFLIGCSSNSDDASAETQDFMITLNVDPMHYGEFFVRAKAFLSDENGEILAEGDLLPGQPTTLSTTTDPSQGYDLSIMVYSYLDFAEEKIYGITTFTDIQPGNFDLGPGPISEDSADEIYINLTNAGYPCIVMSGATGHAPFGPENGGYVNYRGNLVGSPSSDFYIAFISPNDQLYRYFWGEDLPEGSVFNIDYPSLPEIQNVVNLLLPSNDRATFTLQGGRNEDSDNIRHSIALGNFIEGNNSLFMPVPTNVFDYFLLGVTFGNEDSTYFKRMRTASLPNQILTPPLSFTVNNQDLGNFNMDTEGEAIIYSATYRTSNSSSAISIAHSIHGPVSPTISFSKENLWLNIRDYYPDLAGFSALPLGGVSLRNYSEINSYNDILQMMVEQKPYEPTQLGEFLEGHSQQFD